jgi:hypothetical protein
MQWHGKFYRHWTATDMCGNVAACIQTIVLVDNHAPVLQSTSITNDQLRDKALPLNTPDSRSI